MALPTVLTTALRRATAGLTATCVAASLMTAVWAVPARAETDSRELARILAGIAAIALIAKAIDDREDRKRDRKPPRAGHHPGRPYYPAEPYPYPDEPYVPGHQPRPQGALVPRECALEVRGERRNRLAYGESCLVSYGLRHLPRHCAYHATIFGRADRLYPAACLRDSGFRLPRR